MCTSPADPDFHLFSAFPMPNNSNRIFVFVSGMFENWEMLVHGDLNTKGLATGFLQSFLLTL